ncbi:phosphoribosylanthranilate isomerase [Thermosulfidibacter takaii ABI70S6]|uniref:N-(5'-phosphoribosyl)anthranilate isomerase n=1 Tax=Thermosulfidibacter takaii (strain DSM 17441 / JCM 13301 / NBRC 103674 / ABI70S6) TaxID=1298851 RepID=A0A0S3QVC1_THET7|nr:phosphoribosylanthranilate isomerase [Thermosulfidibacter takaii]BAT72276.1 phosphoribosylanthranilate isomerase [Thermosulfidibacter takaii ABI70S6]
MVFVKICGIRDVDTALVAVRAGADAIGLVFHRESPRFVGIELAKEIGEAVKGKVKVFAVIKNSNEFDERFFDVCDYVQCYEPIPGLDSSKLVLGVKGFTDYKAAYYIVDASHGKGMFVEYPHDLWRLPKDRVILSGGLTPDNVKEVIRKYRPFGVDVSSGVEVSPGVKDPEKVVQFVRNAKEALP